MRIPDLRHHATTEMVQAGIHHSEVMKITGHTQMTTFQRYNNPNAERLNAISAQVNAHKETKLRKLMEENENNGSTVFIN